MGPTLIAYRMGMNHGIGVTILMFYVLAGLIRLAWYNVSEEIRQEETTETGNVIKDFRLLLWQLHFLFYMCSVRYLAKILSLPCMRLVLIIGLLFITNFRLQQAEEAGTDCHGCHCRTGSAAWTAYLVENSCKARWNHERIYERLNIK